MVSPPFGESARRWEAAQHSVWLTEAFLTPDFRIPDRRGSLFDVLDAATDRGLDVRVVFWRHVLYEQINPGVQLSGTNREPDQLAEGRYRFRALWDQAEGGYCQHQKSWHIDAGTDTEVAFVGGINLEPPSVVPACHPPTAGGNVHDVYLELQGPPAATSTTTSFSAGTTPATGTRPTAASPRTWTRGGCRFLLAPVRAAARCQYRFNARSGGRYTDSTATPGGNAFPIESAATRAS